MAEIYFINHQSHRSVMKLAPRESSFRKFSLHSLKNSFAIDEFETDTEVETDTATEDTDTEPDTETEPTSFTPTPSSTPTPTPTSTPTSTPATPTPTPTSVPTNTPTSSHTPSPTPTVNVCAGVCKPTTETCRVSNNAPVCDCAATYSRENGECVQVGADLTGEITVPDTDGDLASNEKAQQGYSNGVCDLAGLAHEYCKGDVKTKKAGGTAVFTYEIWIPDGSSVTVTSLQNLMSNTTALIAAINQAFTNLGLSAPILPGFNLVVSFAASPSSSPSPSASLVSPSASPAASSSPVVQAAEKKKSNKNLSSGAIAGIVIGSVCGAILLVALIVFAQMRMQRRGGDQHSAMTTALAVSEDGQSKSRKSDAVDNKRL